MPDTASRATAATNHRVDPLPVMGWGILNLVEGVIDHHILGIHDVVEALGVSIYDYAFLGSGVLFIAIGFGLIRSGQKYESLLSPIAGMNA